jgi:hypothetical protein
MHGPSRHHPSSSPLAPARGDTMHAHRKATRISRQACGVIPTVREGPGARVAARMATPRSEVPHAVGRDNRA